MKLGSKGQIAVAAAILVTAIVGVLIVDSVAAQVWTDTIVLNESLGVVTNGTTDSISNRCLTRTGEALYDWTNGTAVPTSNYTMAPGVYPNRVVNTVTFPAANFAHNNTTIGINYTYGCTFGNNSTYRLVMEYFAVLVGIALLGLAAGWLYLKGGF